MAKFRVWGEWQEYEEAETIEAPSGSGAVNEFRQKHDGDMFPDWNDGDKTKVHVLAEKDASGKEDFDAEGLATTFVVVLRLAVSFDVKQVPRAR